MTMTQRDGLYRRALAITGIMATLAFVGLAYLPDWKLFHQEDLIDYAIPIAFLASALLASSVLLLRRQLAAWRSDLLKGFVEGALLALALIVARYFFAEPGLRSDGVFRWATFCLMPMFLGPPLGVLGAMVRMGWGFFARRPTRRGKTSVHPNRQVHAEH